MRGGFAFLIRNSNHSLLRTSWVDWAKPRAQRAAPACQNGIAPATDSSQSWKDRIVAALQC